MPISRTEFSSGLRVVTERMPSIRSVSIGFWVLAGSRDERPAISGHCHFLEHLLFKGTATRTALDIAEAFDAVGGDVNAFTAKEYTCYYARVLDRDLELAVDHLADMLQHSTIRAEDLKAESQVILSETSTRGSVRGFYRRHYVPGRLVVAAAGNVRHEELVRMLTDRVDAGRELSARGRSTWRLRDAPRPPKPSGDQHVQRKKTEQAHIVIGTNGLSRSDPERFAFLIVNTALGGGMSSRLFQEIREKRGLAYTAYSFHSQFAEIGLFSAYAGTTPGKAREVLGLMRAQIEAVRDGDLDAEEFERAKGHVKGSTVLSLEDPGGRMSRLGKSEIANGEILTVDEILRRVERVSLEDARRIANRVLSQPMTLTVLGPVPPSSFAGALV